MRSARCAAVAGLLLLAGCGRGERDVFDSPIDLYHDLQGGTIASQRPPPPGVGDPYPKLGSVPGRPTPTSAAERRALYAALAAERNRVQQEDARNPLTPPPTDRAPAQPTPSPAPAPARAPAASPAANAPAPAASSADDSAPSVAVLPAAEAPAPKPDRNAARPVAAPGPLPDLQARVTDGGPIPAVPDAPPPPPVLEGVALPVTAPGAASVNVYFRRGSAVVPLDAGAALRQLAAARKDRVIDVRAPGDAGAGRGPDSAAAGLPLGLRRAEAIAAALADAGVPPGSVRVLAEGVGQAGIARVVDRN